MSFKARYILVHCADTPNGSTKWRAWHVDEWHRKRGFRRKQPRTGAFDHIGYHYVIEVDGTVVPGRGLDEKGAHEELRNHDSYGICLMGRDRFTKEQWKALRDLVVTLSETRGPLRVYGHRDWDKQKNCPGFDVETWTRCGMVAPENALYFSGDS